MEQPEELTLSDLSVIKESLKYSKLRMEEYQGHPSYEYKQKSVAEINDVAIKISALIKSKNSQ